MDLIGIGRVEELKQSYRGWVEESLAVQDRERQPRWMESIAVGSEGFVEHTKAALGIKAIGREVIEEEGVYELREPQIFLMALILPMRIVILGKKTRIFGIYPLECQ